MKENIGIIGFGFIGKAITHGMYLHFNIKIYDKYNNIYDTLENTVNKSRYLFIGVPTPMNTDGSQDLSNIDDAIKSIVKIAKSEKIIILKSTIIPGTTSKYAKKYPDHKFVFNPEFLTERQSKLDFINPARIILGGEPDITEQIKNLYKIRFPHTQIFKTSWEAAEIVKYMCNCFFAVKISFLNEMYLISKKIGIEYDELKNLFLSDQRIGNSHADIPGHDGNIGYGGKCFPKDVNAFIKWAESIDMHADMCKTANNINDKIRENKDWNKIVGATSENNYEKCENIKRKLS